MRMSLAAAAAALALGFPLSVPAANIVAPSSVHVAQTVVTLPAGVDTLLGSAHGRSYLCIMNIGTGLVTLGFDRPAVAGSGWALEAASAVGHQGGSMCWESSTVAANDIHSISAAGSTVVVLEGH